MLAYLAPFFKYCFFFFERFFQCIFGVDLNNNLCSVQENGRLEVEYQALAAAGKTGTQQESVQEEKVLR